MTTYQFEYWGDDDLPSFTVEADDEGNVVKSDNESIAGRIGEPLNTIGWLKRRYGQRQQYEVSEVRETKKSANASTFTEEMGEVGEVAKLDVDKQLVFGWAYVTHTKDGELVVDKSGEFIDDPGVLEDAAYNFVIKSRVAGDSHQRDLTKEFGPKQVGTMIESMVFTPEKVSKMGLPKGVLPTGWWCGFRIDDDKVWAAVKRGERPAFSIHGKARKVAASDDES